MKKIVLKRLGPIPVVDEAADVAIEGSITCVRVLILTVEVKVEEIGSENKEYSDPYVRTSPNTKQVKSYKGRHPKKIDFVWMPSLKHRADSPSLGVVLLPSLLRLLAGDHLPNIPGQNQLVSTGYNI